MAVIIIADPAFAQDGIPPGEFSFSIGYAHVSIGDSGSSVLDSENALRFDGSLTYALFPQVPQLRLGGAVGVSLVLDDTERTIISNGGLVIIGSSDVPLYLIEPEFRLSWQQFLDAGRHVYIEPGIGVGGVIGNLSLDADATSSGRSFDESDAAFSARVFLNLGFRAAGGYAGLQASYMRGQSLDFAENARGDVEEFYIGIFGSLRF